MKTINSLSELKTLLNDTYHETTTIKSFEDFADITSYYPDVDNAISVVLDHIKNEDFILLVTDTDVDGLLSGKIFDIFFKKIGYTNYHIDIAKRGNGYGIQLSNVDECVKSYEKPALVLTSDNGITSSISIELIKEKYPEMKVIVTDHHLVNPDLYPKKADFVFNPQKMDENHYSKDFCGGVVAGLFLNKLSELGDFDFSYDDIVEEMAITTMADVMKLDNPYNRFIVKEGLKRINSKDYTSTNRFYLVNFTKYDKGNIDKTFVDFSISPVLNSAKRMNTEDIAIRFILAENKKTSESLYVKLKTSNENRKSLQKSVWSDVVDSGFLDDNIDKHAVTLKLSKTNGINGIIANKILDTLSTPTIVFDEDTLQGSGRSFDGFHLIELLDRIDKFDNTLLSHYDGHAAACGVGLNSGAYKKFNFLFNKVVEKHKKENSSTIRVKSDDTIHLSPELVGETLYNMVSLFAPFGNNWEKPIFTSTVIVHTYRVHKGSHNYLEFKNGSTIIKGWKWNDNRDHNLKKGDKCVLTYEISKNNFQGKVSYQVIIQTIKGLDSDRDTTSS
jgi:single-stranded-DNA-specific exonuclease